MECGDRTDFLRLHGMPELMNLQALSHSEIQDLGGEAVSVPISTMFNVCCIDLLFAMGQLVVSVADSGRVESRFPAEFTYAQSSMVIVGKQLAEVFQQPLIAQHH